MTERALGVIETLQFSAQTSGSVVTASTVVFFVAHHAQAFGSHGVGVMPGKVVISVGNIRSRTQTDKVLRTMAPGTVETIIVRLVATG
jgi:hypothetical protein